MILATGKRRTFFNWDFTRTTIKFGMK